MLKAGQFAIVLTYALSLLLVTVLSASAGIKKVVAVQDFVNKAGQSQWDTGKDFDLGSAMADQLTDSLIHSGQFVVLERMNLDSVIEEQDNTVSGRFQQSQSARIGKLTSAQVLVQGVITELEVNAKSGGTGISFAGVRLGRDTQEVHLGMIIRLIDTTTGEVIDSQRVDGNAESSGNSIGLSISSFNIGNQNNTQTPIGEAIQLAINDAVEYIAGRLRNLPFQGRVIKVAGNTVFIGAGMNQNVAKGDAFNVYSVGEELIDPSTGELLGRDEELIGRATVFSVKEKFSKAKVSGDSQPKVGDTVRSELDF